MEGRVGQVQALIAVEPSTSEGAEGMVEVLRRLCAAAAKALAAWGAGVSVISDDGVRVLRAASGEASARIDELQSSLGEGPCMAAFASRRPVLEPDLASGALARWPVFAAAAQDEGVRAVFAFPLQVGAARLGVLNLYREKPGSLSSEELTQALTFADVATTMLVDGGQKAPDGRAAGGLDEALEWRFEVHQAQGMIMVRLRTTLADALALLRAYAYSHDRALGEVAIDVVAGRLRLAPDTS